MEIAERRKLNRLLRKPHHHHPGLNKHGGSAKHARINQATNQSNRPGGRHPPHGSRSSTAPSPPSNEQTVNLPKGCGLSADVMKLCAEMCGVSNLSTDAVRVLQRHVNQIVKLLVHSILRVMEQSRRGLPQASDVDLASVLMGLEPPFGTVPSSFLPLRTGGRTATSGTGGKIFFLRPDKEIDVKALLLREPAGVVYDVSLVAHWLAVNGKQPVAPQNPPTDFINRMNALNGGGGHSSSANDDAAKLTVPLVQSGTDVSKSALSASFSNKSTTNPIISPHPRVVSSVFVDRRPHDVSQEVMIYFRELTEACVGSSENRRHEALENITLDPGLQPALPHLVTFITEGVRINVANHNLAILIYLMRLVKALVDNAHITLEPYLHALVPTVITCVLSRQLCAKPITDNHWALRDFAAKQLVTLCNRYNTSANELYNRITRELSRALKIWIDESGTTSVGESVAADTSDAHQNSTLPALTADLHSRPTTNSADRPITSLGSSIHSMNTLYGILASLAEFGAQTLRILVFPLLPSLCNRLTVTVDSSLTASVHQKKDEAAVMPIAFTPPSRLSPADQRSYDYLKKLMSNRIAPLLGDWRSRHSAGITLTDYESDYRCMAAYLHSGNRSTLPTPATPAPSNTVGSMSPSVTSSTAADSSSRLSVLTTALTSGVLPQKHEEGSTRGAT